MNKFFGSCLMAVFAGALSNSAFAHKQRGRNNPCTPVYQACVSAGKTGKDAKACVETIKGGGTIDGVNVSEAAIDACESSAKKEGVSPSGNGAQ